MSRFLIGQVCNALGVRAHVLRYWERHVELLSPAKDRSGRRMYTLRDVQLLSRLKHLVYTRGMSVEGASRKLVEEVQGGGQNRKAALDSLRGDLFRVSLGAQRLGERLEETADTAADRGEMRSTEHGGALAAGLPQIVLDVARRSGAAPGEPARQDDAAGDGVVRAARHSGADADGGGDREPGGAADRGGTTDPGGDKDFAAARSLLRRAPLLVFSPAPPFGDTVERYPGLLPLLGRGGETVLDRIGRRLSALGRDFGHEPLWIIGASKPVLSALRGHVARRGFYGLSPGRVQVSAEPRLPDHTAADGSQPTYELMLIVPVTNALPLIPDLEFISRHLDSGAGVSVKAAGVSSADGPAEPTGEAIVSTGLYAAVPRDIPGEDIPGVVRRFRGEDDIIEGEATRGRFGMERLLAAADIGLVFEIDAGAEVASLRSPADWDTCSHQVRERS